MTFAVSAGTLITSDNKGGWYMEDNELKNVSSTSASDSANVYAMNNKKAVPSTKQYLSWWGLLRQQRCSSCLAFSLLA